MDIKKLFTQAYQVIQAIIAGNPEVAHLWEHIAKLHPADSADFFQGLSRPELKVLFVRLAPHAQVGVFLHVSTPLKLYILSFLPDQERSVLLSHIPLDELTDLFEELSDKELKQYLSLLTKKDRKKVLALLQFDPESAGGIMDTDVLTLMQDFTVENSVHVVQRLQPRKELHRCIYVTNQDNQLVGYIKIEDLVLHKPNERLSQFMRTPILAITVNEDREEVANKMRHYDVMLAPVIGDDNLFLGVIDGDTLVDIITQEASEDVYLMSAMPAIKYTYFETPFVKMLLERSSILFILLWAQLFSSLIIERYDALICGFLTYFITMLVSTGGNSSSQTSAVVIQGMASGEIHAGNVWRFLRREFSMAFMIALILGVAAFIRVWIFHPNELQGAWAVSVSLSAIVLVSVILGSCMPIILKKMRMDPAYAAGPFLATIMDILGLLIYTQICSYILG